MKPQTLGDALDVQMEARDDSPAVAALALGITTDELAEWLGDERLPTADQAAGVIRYLGVDVPHYRGLCLRSQMRRVQTSIRSGPPMPRSA
jgi:hypothetical protein